MSKCSAMVCYFCRAEIESADHIALDEEGEPVALCDACYKLASIFFEKGKDKNGKS